MRAPVQPRRGRLVCVDFADWLLTWRPGRVADLHAIPSACDDAVRVLRRVPVPAGPAAAVGAPSHRGMRMTGLTTSPDPLSARACSISSSS